MTLQQSPAALSDEETIRCESQLLSAVSTEQAKGNVALIRELGWTEELYWKIRNRLIDKGLLEKGRGKGGSVRKLQPIVVNVEPTIAEEIAVEKILKIREIDLYPSILQTIKTSWVGDHDIETFTLESSAKKGSMETGGKWSRPDITLATYTTYPYVPGKHFDVITFEVKVAEGFDVTAVYEALAHRRAATKSWIFLYVIAAELASFEKIIDDVQVEAKRHGIGMIVATDLEKYDSWDERLAAERFEPDPARLNEFISKLSIEFKEKLARWFR